MNIRVTLRATLIVFALDASSRGQSHPDGGTPFRAPGPCVAVPDPTWRIERSITQSSPPDPAYPFSHDDAVAMSSSRPFDLDGDGVNDSLVPEPSAGDCTQDFHFAIYLRRGSCGHRVGVVYGSIDLTNLASAPRHAGLPDLTTTTERQRQPDPRVPAELVRETRTYRFDGAIYREVNHSTRAAVCHHCPSVQCRVSSSAP